MLQQKKFYDIDVAVIGNETSRTTYRLLNPVFEWHLIVNEINFVCLLS